MITKGGHGSGIRGHRTIRDTVSKLSPKAKKDVLDKLKTEQAKRSITQGSINSTEKADFSYQFSQLEKGFKKAGAMAGWTKIVDLSKELVNNKEFREYAEKKYPLSKKEKSIDAVQKLVNDRIILWNKTSGDHDKDAVALQHAVKDAFSLSDSSVKHMTSIDVVKDKDMYVANLAFAKATYNQTQASLKSLGIEEVTVFRGFDDTKKEMQEGVSNHSLAPASSFSVDFSEASRFAKMGQNGKVLAAKIKAKDVFSLGFTGIGHIGSSEVVVLGKNQQIATVDIKKIKSKNKIDAQNEFNNALKTIRKSSNVLYCIDSELVNADWIKKISDPSKQLSDDLLQKIIQRVKEKLNIKEVSKEDWIQAWKDDPHWDKREPSKLVNRLLGETDKKKVLSILELGCGNGVDSIAFGGEGHHVTGIDISPDAIKLANKNNKFNNVTFEVGDAEKLKFKDNYFDLVYSMAVLHSSDLKKSIPELARVLNPKGKALLFLYQKTDYEYNDETEVNFKYKEIEGLFKENKLDIISKEKTDKKDKDENGVHWHYIVIYMLEKE